VPADWRPRRASAASGAAPAPSQAADKTPRRGHTNAILLAGLRPAPDTFAVAEKRERIQDQEHFEEKNSNPGRNGAMIVRPAIRLEIDSKSVFRA